MVVDIQCSDLCRIGLRKGIDIYDQRTSWEDCGDDGGQREEKPEDPKDWNMPQYVKPIQHQRSCAE